jgi:hypothetical protein
MIKNKFSWKSNFPQKKISDGENYLREGWKENQEEDIS